MKLELWSVTSFRFQALVLKICTTKVADRVLGRSQKRQIVWTVLCVALWCSHRGRALLLLVVSWASSTIQSLNHAGVYVVVLQRGFISERVEAFLSYRKLSSPSQLLIVVLFLVTGKIIQPDVTLSTSVVAFVVIVDKDFKPLRLMWGRPGSDRLWCVRVCVFVKVETPEERSNLHDIYTSWMK